MKANTKGSLLESRPSQSGLLSLKGAGGRAIVHNNGSEGFAQLNNTSNGDSRHSVDFDGEDTMIVKREGVLITDLLYRLHRRSTKLVDTHIICSDGYIPVHRCVLMACSKFLMRLLIQEDPADMASICLPDYKVGQVIPLINSFYTGCVLFSKSDLNTTLELISVLQVDPLYSFQPAKEQDKKWAPKMRHYLENKENQQQHQQHQQPASPLAVASSHDSLPRASSASITVSEKRKIPEKYHPVNPVDGDKSNQSFPDELSPQSREDNSIIEVDIEEIDDPEFPPDLEAEGSDDDIKILEILSGEPVISDVTEVTEDGLAFADNPAINSRTSESRLSSIKSTLAIVEENGTNETAGETAQDANDCSDDPYDDYVFSPMAMDLATNVIVRQEAAPRADDDEDSNDKDPLELESLVFDKDFADSQEGNYRGRAYEFETIAFDETGQRKQIAQILTEPVPLTSADTDPVPGLKPKPPPRKTRKSRKARSSGRQRRGRQNKSLLKISQIIQTPEENILGVATPPHLRRKSFDKAEEQKKRMEDIRFSHQLQQQLQYSLETQPVSSTDITPSAEWRQQMDLSPKTPLIQESSRKRSREEIRLARERKQREDEEALLTKFAEAKKLREEESQKLEEAQKKRDEEALKKQAEQATRKLEDARRKQQERLKDQEARKALDALEGKLRREAEEEECRRKKKLEEEEQERRKEELEKAKIEEEEKRLKEKEKRMKEEAEGRRREEEARQNKEEEEGKRRKEVEESRRQAEEEEERKQAEEEARRMELEEERRREVAWLKQETEKKRLSEEERRRRDEDKARREQERRFQEEAVLLAQMKLLEQAKQLQEEERRKKLEEDRVRLEREAARNEEEVRRRRILEQEEINCRLQEEKRLKEERRREKELRRQQERDKAEEERQKLLEAEQVREEEERRRQSAQEEAIRQAFLKASLGKLQEEERQKAEEERQKGEEEKQRTEEERQRTEGEREKAEEEARRLEAERLLREEAERKEEEARRKMEAERREKERLEEEKRIEEELALQIEKDMEQSDYQPSVLGVPEPKRRPGDQPPQQPKSTPFFEAFVKKKQKILEEEKRKKAEEEERKKQQEKEERQSMCERDSSFSPQTSVILSSADTTNSAKVRHGFMEESQGEELGRDTGGSIGAMEICQEPQTPPQPSPLDDDETSTGAVPEAFVAVSEEIVIAPEQALLSLPDEAQQDAVYELCEDIPMAETEIELGTVECEAEVVTTPEVEVETTVETIDERHIIEPSEEKPEQEVPVIDISTEDENPPSPEVVSTPSSTELVVDESVTVKPKSSKKKRSKKVREKHTQVKPQMISPSTSTSAQLPKKGSVIVHTAQAQRRSSRSSDSSARGRFSPEPVSLKAATRALIKYPQKPVKTTVSGKSYLIQNPRIKVDRLSNAKYSYYMIRLKRYKRMRRDLTPPPPTLKAVTSPGDGHGFSAAHATSRWKVIRNDLTNTNTKSLKRTTSVDDGPPPLLQPEMPSGSKQKKTSSVAPMGIENFPAVSQPAYITVNDLDWYQKELRRCSHCNRRYTSHIKASSCLLNHGFKRCLICLDLVSSVDTSYELHYAKHHSVPKQRGYVGCPICGKLLLHRGLQTHVTRKHLLPEPSKSKSPSLVHNLPQNFYYPHPSSTASSSYSSHYSQNSQYTSSQRDSEQSSSSVRQEPQVQPLVLDLKKINYPCKPREIFERSTSIRTVRLSESDEEEDHGEVNTEGHAFDDIAGDRNERSSNYKIQNGSFLDANTNHGEERSLPAACYSFKETSREVPIELVPNQRTTLVDAEMARRAYQQLQAEQNSVTPAPTMSPEKDPPPPPISHLTIERTPVIERPIVVTHSQEAQSSSNERPLISSGGGIVDASNDVMHMREERESLPLVPTTQSLKRMNHDYIDMSQSRKKYYHYSDYDYDRRPEPDLHMARIPTPYCPIPPPAPSHLPNHHDFFAHHRPNTMHHPQPSYIQNHHMYSHIQHHPHPPPPPAHPLSHELDNEFPIINPGITVDESSGQVLCELMPVNYHASPIPLQQPYNSSGPKGPSAIPAPMQDIYDTSASMNLSRPPPSIFSTPPLSNTPSSTSSYHQDLVEDNSRRHHPHHGHHSSHHHQSIHHHQNWELHSIHRSDTVISNMDYMKLAESMGSNEGSLHCERCNGKFYSHEALANHRCYDHM